MSPQANWSRSRTEFDLSQGTGDRGEQEFLAITPLARALIHGSTRQRIQIGGAFRSRIMNF